MHACIVEESARKSVRCEKEQILDGWVALLKQSGAFDSVRMKESELQVQTKSFLTQLRAAIEAGDLDSRSANYENSRALLTELSRSRAVQGFSSSETARFVFSLKKALFDAVREESSGDIAAQH